MTVEYETVPGWKSSTCSCRKFQELPENARNYVLKIEQLLNIPGESLDLGSGNLF